MLQVTFRNLLPSESLLALARHEYQRLHVKHASEMRGASCSVTIANRRKPHDQRDDYHVQVEVLRDRAATLLAVSASEDAALALRTGMVAAVSSTSRALSPPVASRCA